MKKFFFWFFVVFAVIGIIGAMTESGKMSEIVPPTVIFAVLAFFLRPRSEAAMRRKEDERTQKRIQAEILRQRRLRTLSGDHAAGLPLAAGVDCTLCFDPDRLTISGGGSNFRLAYDKIRGIEVHTDVELQKTNVSSIGGAIGGYMLFGGVGAAVGGRAKEHTAKIEEYYTIITYLKDGKLDSLVFRVNDVNQAQAVLDEHRRKWSGTASQIKPIDL